MKIMILLSIWLFQVSYETVCKNLITVRPYNQYLLFYKQYSECQWVDTSVIKYSCCLSTKIYSRFLCVIAFTNNFLGLYISIVWIYQICLVSYKVYKTAFLKISCRFLSSFLYLCNISLYLCHLYFYIYKKPFS